MQNHKQFRGVDLKRFVRKNKIKKDFSLNLILLNLSYATNVASIFRSADAFGVDKIYLIGCTPTPPFGKDLKNVSRSKESAVDWEYVENFESLSDKLHKDGFKVFGLELATNAKQLSTLSSANFEKVALVVGNEEHGIPDKHLLLMDEVYYISMNGKGRSLNVSTTAAIGLYQMSVGV